MTTQHKPFIIEDTRFNILPLIVRPLLEVLNGDPGKITERRFERGGGWEGWLQQEYQDQIEYTFGQATHQNATITREEEIANGMKPDVIIQTPGGLHHYKAQIIELKCQSSYGAKFARNNFLDRNILVDQRKIISCNGVALDAYQLLNPYLDYKNTGGILFWSLAVHADPQYAKEYEKKLADLSGTLQNTLQVELGKKTKFCNVNGLINYNGTKPLYPYRIWISCVGSDGKVPGWWDKLPQDLTGEL